MSKQYKDMIIWYISRARIEVIYAVCRRLGIETRKDGIPLSILGLYTSVSKKLDEIDDSEAYKWIEFVKNAYHMEVD